VETIDGYRLFPSPAGEGLTILRLPGSDEHARGDPVVTLGWNSCSEQAEEFGIEERIERTLGDPERFDRFDHDLPKTGPADTLVHRDLGQGAR
jgi:hypothetical protein